MRDFIHNLALRGEGMVPAWIPAVVVDQVVPLHPRHSRHLLLAQPPCPRGGHRRRAAGARSAPAYPEILVPTNERLVLVVCLVLAVLRGPG